jgi:chromosome segregation ATPase
VETESACEALHKELSGLQRRRAELEEELRVKEKGYQLALDESRRSERRLDEQRQRLEASLDNAGAELSETRLRLSAADGRITALEAQLARVEAGRGEIEGKLTSIVSGLRRYIGFSGGVRSRSISQLRARSPSPVRSRPTAPTKGMFTIFQTSLLRVIDHLTDLTRRLDFGAAVARMSLSPFAISK